MLKRITKQMIGFIVILFYLTACSQPIQELPGTSGEPEGYSLNFNYSITGAFDKAISRESTRASGELYRSKMYITNLETGETKTHDWIVLIDKETMEVTSYSSVALKLGKYSFELVVTRGSYNYYARSGPIELKNGANSIPLKLTPVIGDFISGTATVTDLSCISNLIYKFSTVQLAMINDPRLGYSINGSEEIIIKLNKTTGLAPVKICLPDGSYPIELKFYDGTTLLGTNLRTKTIRISPAFSSSTIDLYPLYGDCSFEISSGTGEANFTLTLTKEISAILHNTPYVHNLHSTITIQYPDHSVTKEFSFKKSDNPAYKEIATGVIKGLTYGKANIIIDIFNIYGETAAHRTIARSITKDVTIGESGGKLDITYQLFPKNSVDSSLKSIVKLSLFSAEGTPIFSGGYSSYVFTVDGKELSYNDVVKKKGSRLLTVDSDAKLLEIKKDESSKTLLSFPLSLKPFEVTEINYTFPASSQWRAIPEDYFYKGLPQPFEKTIKLGSKTVRVRETGPEGSRKISIDMVNSSGNGWVKAAPDYHLAADEIYRLEHKSWTVDSKNRLYLAIYNKPYHSYDPYYYNKKIIRLSADCNAWELLPEVAERTKHVFKGKEGHIYTSVNSKENMIKKLKPDASGWEDYQLPPFRPNSDKSQFQGIGGHFTDIHGNFLAAVDYGRPDTSDTYLYKYNSNKKQWDAITTLQLSLYQTYRVYNMFSHSFDEQGNIYTTYHKQINNSGPGRYTSISSTISVSKYDNQSNLELFDVSLKSLFNLHIGALAIKGDKGNAYIIADPYRRGFTPYLATIAMGSQTLDESLSEDMPVIPDYLSPKLAIAEDGTLFLRYYNKALGLSYYYMKN